MKGNGDKTTKCKDMSIHRSIMVFSSFDTNVYFTCILTQAKGGSLTASCLGSCSATVLKRETVGFLAASRMSWTLRSPRRRRPLARIPTRMTPLRTRAWDSDLPERKSVNLNVLQQFNSIKSQLASKSSHCLSVTSSSASSTALASFSSSESDTSLRARSECETIRWTAWSSSSTG